MATVPNSSKYSRSQRGSQPRSSPQAPPAAPEYSPAPRTRRSPASSSPSSGSPFGFVPWLIGGICVIIALYSFGGSSRNGAQQQQDNQVAIERQRQNEQINQQRYLAEQERLQRQEELRRQRQEAEIQRQQDLQRRRRQAELERRARYLDSIRCGDFSDVGRICCPLGQRPDNIYTGNWNNPYRYVCVQAD